MRKLLILVTLITTVLASPLFAETTYEVKEWEIPTDKAVAKYLPSDKYIAVNFRDKEYENIVLDLFIRLNPNLDEKVKIVRSIESPIRELLLIENKLYSVKEIYPLMDAITYKDYYLKLTGLYSYPTVTLDGAGKRYSFSDKEKKTQVVMIVTPAGEKYDIVLYFYEYYWSRSLILMD